MTTTRERLDQARSELAAARSRIAELEQRAAGPRVAITATARSLDQATNRASELRSELDQAAAALAGRNRLIHQLNDQVEGLGRRIASLEDTEVGLRAELTQALARVRELEAQKVHAPIQHLPEGLRGGLELCTAHHAVSDEVPICPACYYVKVQQLNAHITELEGQRDRARQDRKQLSDKLVNARIRVADALQQAQKVLEL